MTRGADPSESAGPTRLARIFLVTRLVKTQPVAGGSPWTAGRGQARYVSGFAAVKSGSSLPHDGAGYAQEATLRHEVGHLLGFDHVEAAGDQMHAGRTAESPNGFGAREIREDYRSLALPRDCRDG